MNSIGNLLGKQLAAAGGVLHIFDKGPSSTKLADVVPEKLTFKGGDLKNESLNAYREPFKAAVLKHIQETLGAGEWERLRSMAANRNRFVNRSDTEDLEATPEELLNVALSEDGISVEQTLVPFFKAKAVQIDQIEGQPVYYVDGQGIYIWGLEPANGLTLMFWVTHPAYPPRW